MKCKTCGGNLTFNSGIYTCNNCGKMYNSSDIFENIEVFICYIESDEYNRRSIDSVIANRIYQNLQSCGIETFYERASIDGLSSDAFSAERDKAFYYSKLVILFAGSKENFQKLLEQNKTQLYNKKIIPVYSTIAANDLPKEIAGIQAIQYDRIGSAKDLSESVFSILGKSSELDIRDLYKKRNRKPKCLSLFFFSLSLLLLIICLCVIFLSPLILPSKKYEYAKKLLNTDNTSKAVSILSDIANYKDSQTVLDSIYNQYSGMYKSGDDITLNIQYGKNQTVNINCTYNNSYFESVCTFEKCISCFTFRDTNNNLGQGSVTINNSDIILNLEYNSQNEVFTFNINDKIDQTTKTITKEIILSWLSGDVNIKTLQKENYELQYIKTVHGDFGKIYEIKDYPIQLFVSDNFYDNEPITAICAPAGLIASAHIGDPDTLFLENNVMYVPNGAFPNSSLFSLLNAFDEGSQKTIYADTPVYITKEYLVEQGAWASMLYDMGDKKALKEYAESFKNNGDIDSYNFIIDYYNRLQDD